MDQKLFDVEDTFYIKPRTGIVVVGEFRQNSTKFKIGDGNVLTRPNGSKIITEVSGIEMPLTVSGIKKAAIWIRSIKKEDVPVGTEIFLKLD